MEFHAASRNRIWRAAGTDAGGDGWGDSGFEGGGGAGGFAGWGDGVLGRADGDEVGQVLADRLNVPLYNKKTLTELAKKKGILEHYPDYFGENPAGTLLAVIAEDDGEDSVVHRTPRKVLDELIGETSCILIGRAGNYAYQKENDVVRVFLSGDRESRIHHLMEKHKVKRHEAESVIEKTESLQRYAL